MAREPATPALSSGRLTIDLGAVARNWQGLDAICTNAKVAAVVKADAYGLGMTKVAQSLYAVGARFFFVATLQEGVDLRAVLPGAHIFVLNGLWPGTPALYTEQRLMPVLSSMPMLEEWLRYCLSIGSAFPSAIQFDTGMNRLGFRIKDAEWVRQQITNAGYKPQLIMSHLACADDPAHEKNRTQLALFQSLLTHFPNVAASLANSGGTMLSKNYHFSLTRPGIALYGGAAVSGRKNPMARAVSLLVPILQVRDAQTGETVGYGATQTLTRKSKIAILSCGYADGLMRHLSGSNRRSGGKVFVRGQFAPILGRISMDTVAVDVTDLDEAVPRPGEFVEILGANITIDDIGAMAGSISYEILTSLTGRYDRRYINAPPAVADTEHEAAALSLSAQ